MGPVLAMVTDRRRCGACWEQGLPTLVRAAAEAGVHLVQVRELDLDGRALVALVARCVAAVLGTRTRVLVNDRVDVALAAGAHGVHLPASGASAARLRSMVPAGFLLGRSVHSMAEATAAVDGAGLDYLVFGTVFPSASKPGRAAAGTAALEAVVRASSLPVLAIGGVTAERAGQVAAAGAAGLAAIGLFAADTVGQVRATVHSTVASFDTLRRT